MTNNQSNELRDAINEYGTQVALITKRFISGEYDEAERDRLWLEAATALGAYCKDRERQARIEEATYFIDEVWGAENPDEIHPRLVARIKQIKGDKL